MVFGKRGGPINYSISHSANPTAATEHIRTEVCDKSIHCGTLLVERISRDLDGMYDVPHVTMVGMSPSVEAHVGRNQC